MVLYQNKKLAYSIAALVIVHLVGVIGIHSSYSELFLFLTPINLLLSISLIFFNEKIVNKQFLLTCFIIFILGFLVELAGVKTGRIFGSYQYGKTLGPAIFGIPVIIGINWLILIYSTTSICSSLSTNNFVKSILSATLMTGMDILIEPVAIRYDFWHWENNIIPLQNYLAWFLISIFFSLLFIKYQPNKNNLAATVLYIVQLVFFSLLNIF